MTADQFDTKYRSVLVTFDLYYKYAFTFAGTARDGTTIRATMGGNAEDIYRESVAAGVARPFGASSDWTHVTATDAAGVVIFDV